MEWIVEFAQAFVGSGRTCIEFCWHLHIQRLVGPDIVVVVDEVIESCLLLQEILCCRFGGLDLQCQMHALVTAVLLRMTGLDALDVDAESQPPHVIAIYGGRQTVIKTHGAKDLSNLYVKLVCGQLGIDEKEL